MNRARGNALRILIYRSEARRIAQESVTSNPELISAGAEPHRIRFAAIDQRALDAYLDWGAQAQNYRWLELPKWMERDTKAFDLSIWYADNLCGLCYATPRKSTIRIKIVLLEGCPGQSHPLRGLVLGLALIPIDTYARLLGLRLIEVQDPNEGTVPHYQRLGFSYDNEGHLAIEVSR